MQEQIQVHTILKTSFIYYLDVPSCVGDCFVCLCFLFLPFFLGLETATEKSGSYNLQLTTSKC